MEIICNICAIILVTIINDSFGQENNQNGSPTIDFGGLSAKRCHEYAQAVYEDMPIILLRGPIKTIKKDVCGHQNKTLIGSDYTATPREFPHMAAIGFIRNNKTEWRCGGTLISDRYVLTAGQCAASPLGAPNYVRIGDINMKSENDDADPEILSVTEVILHPEYKPPSAYNDIALLKLDHSVKFNKYKRPACLPTQEGNNAREGVATGWGNQFGPMIDNLRKVPLNILSSSECDNIIKKNAISSYLFRKGVDYSTQICAQPKFENNDTGKGDAGVPIQVYHTSEYCMYEIIGITSIGTSPVLFGLYTKVFPYIEWIENTLNGIRVQSKLEKNLFYEPIIEIR